MQRFVILPLGLQLTSLILHIVEFSQLIRNFLFKDAYLLVGLVDFFIDNFDLYISVALIFQYFVKFCFFILQADVIIFQVLFEHINLTFYLKLLFEMSFQAVSVSLNVLNTNISMASARLNILQRLKTYLRWRSSTWLSKLCFQTLDLKL